MSPSPSSEPVEPVEPVEPARHAASTTTVTDLPLIIQMEQEPPPSLGAILVIWRSRFVELGSACAEAPWRLVPRYLYQLWRAHQRLLTGMRADRVLQWTYAVAGCYLLTELALGVVYRVCAALGIIRVSLMYGMTVGVLAPLPHWIVWTQGASLVGFYLCGGLAVVLAGRALWREMRYPVKGALNESLIHWYLWTTSTLIVTALGSFWSVFAFEQTLPTPLIANGWPVAALLVMAVGCGLVATALWFINSAIAAWREQPARDAQPEWLVSQEQAPAVGSPQVSASDPHSAAE